MTETRSKRLRARLRVRYNECDPQGVVFNANYFTYFDVALTELFREALGSYGALFEHDSDLMVVEASAWYHGAAVFDDELRLELAPVHLGRSSMVTEIDVIRDDAVLVRGRMVHVFVSLRSRRARDIPEPVRRALEPYLAEPSSAPAKAKALAPDAVR